MVVVVNELFVGVVDRIVVVYVVVRVRVKL